MGKLKDFCTDDSGEIHPEWLEDIKRVKEYLAAKGKDATPKNGKKIRKRKPQTI